MCLGNNRTCKLRFDDQTAGHAFPPTPPAVPVPVLNPLPPPDHPPPVNLWESGGQHAVLDQLLNLGIIRV